jgi:hypothetical protein
MPTTPSIMGLHLRYRLWIAEMNSDISVLRIFSDYLIELESNKNRPDVIAKMDHFKQDFITFRKTIDELRHEMQLIKMKLAAATRDYEPVNGKASLTYDHNALKNRYSAFRSTFNKVKKEFVLFTSAAGVPNVLSVPG